MITLWEFIMEINTFIDLCSGIGGGRLGLELAGLKCLAYSDTSRLAVQTYKLMHDTEGEIFYSNIKKINTNLLPKYDMLIAGFPCQTFSVIGRKDGFNDKRGQIIFYISDILKKTKPTCFLLENVKGLTTHDNGKSIKKILSMLKASGYNVIYKVLTSLDYGVPQMRQRVYFVGFREDINLNIEEFEWPKTSKRPSLNKYLVDNQLISTERLNILHHYLNNPTNNGNILLKT